MTTSRISFHALLAPESRLPLATVVVIAAGVVVRFAVAPAPAAMLWLVGLVVLGAPVVWRTVREAFRGHFATDVVAMMAIVGAVLLRQPVAGLIVVLMQTGGEALERFAAARASAAIRALEAAAPRIAHLICYRADASSADDRGAADRGAGDHAGNDHLAAHTLKDVPVDDVAIGDRLLVRPGELVPCDSIVEDGRSHVDTSTLTGEPVPVAAEPGTRLMSGSANQEGALTIRALALASESQYARIVELVRAAQESKAPLQRLADRYAVWFTPATLVVCALAYGFTHDWVRVLAVLVVATPCPLILATPVAIVGGINRAARRQIIVRHGGALEALSEVDTAVFDKTGTLTIGHPEVSRVVAAPGWSEERLLRLAGAVEQGSGHLLARSVVRAAESKLGALPSARHHVESPGRGLTAEVEGHEVAVGARAFVLEHAAADARTLAALESRDTGLRAYVAVDGALVGVIEYADAMRPGVRAFLAGLRELGVSHTVLLSGDHTPNVREVAAAAGIEDARGDLLPEGKVAVVHQLAHAGRQTLMVGDGVNDAPALSSAHVGIALAGHGGGVTAEAADVVILADDLTRVAEAITIAKRTLSIARQSIWLGLGLSTAAMAFAAHGLIPPTAGALLQEAIDVAAIVNALRAAGGPAAVARPSASPDRRSSTRSLPPSPVAATGQRTTGVSAGSP